MVGVAQSHLCMVRSRAFTSHLQDLHQQQERLVAFKLQSSKISQAVSRAAFRRTNRSNRRLFTWGNLLIREVVKGVEDRVEANPFIHLEANKRIINLSSKCRESRWNRVSFLFPDKTRADKTPNILFVLAQTSPDMVYLNLCAIYSSPDWSLVTVPFHDPELNQNVHPCGVDLRVNRLLRREESACCDSAFNSWPLRMSHRGYAVWKKRRQICLFRHERCFCHHTARKMSLFCVCVFCTLGFFKVNTHGCL